MNDNQMLVVENVSKMYKLGQIGGGTLKGDLQSWIARRRGKEDPNSIIGARQAKKGDTFLALNGINLTVNKGERVGLIGHNGAGKSTLLKLISRVTGPTEGAIGYNGRITSMLEVGTGFHDELTGRENIYLNGAILGMTKNEIDKKVEEIIEFAEVAKFIDTPIKRYSSGMRVKLGFSIAAHLDSEIMIMDEVLAVGDMAFQNKCLDKMNEISREQGKTILYVSHNMNTIRKLCTRTVVLNHGEVEFDGSVAEGIAIYLGGRQELTSICDLSKYSRPGWLGNQLRMQYLEMLNIEGATFEVGNDMNAKVKIKANEDLTDVYIRTNILTNDSEPVTTYVGKQSFSLKTGMNTLRLQMPTKHLAPGKYGLQFGIYIKDRFNNRTALDWMEEVSEFEVIATSGFNEGMPWLAGAWGHVWSPMMDVIPEE